MSEKELTGYPSIDKPWLKYYSEEAINAQIPQCTILLTDLARYKNPENPGDVIIKWMSNKSSFDFYSLWEELSNEDFKLAEFREFKNDSSTQSFTMSPSRWINATNAKGIISKRGRYDGGTFAHPDIALEFAS